MIGIIRKCAAEMGSALLDFIFPRSCPMCGAILHDDQPLCSSCADSFRHTSQKYDPPERTIPDVDAISILMPYTAECRNVVHALKYHANPAVGNWLGSLMAERLHSRNAGMDNGIIVPVPLHPRRERERGYNQSERIAHGIAGHGTDLKIRTDILSRTRATQTQTRLSESARRENVRGIFRYNASEPLHGIPVFLVDDVLTTGSTISECARVLKDHGAGPITVCVAATPHPDDN